jgi:ABC-2 type transport system permease protein
MTTAYLGDPDLGAVACGYLGSALVAGAYLSVGMVTSAMTRNQVISFVLAVVACLFLVLAGWPPVTELLVRWAPNWLVEAVAAISVIPHFESMQRGVIDLQDLAYYASVMVVMLVGAHLVLDSRRAI